MLFTERRGWDLAVSVLGARNDQSKVVEICAGDGIECNAANLIINHGWHGLPLDGNADHVSQGRQSYATGKNTWIAPPKFVHAWVTADNVNSLVGDHGFAGEIDLLSLDMDGNDYGSRTAFSIASSHESWSSSSIPTADPIAA